LILEDSNYTFLLRTNYYGSYSVLIFSYIWLISLQFFPELHLEPGGCLNSHSVPPVSTPTKKREPGV